MGMIFRFVLDFPVGLAIEDVYLCQITRKRERGGGRGQWRECLLSSCRLVDDRIRHVVNLILFIVDALDEILQNRGTS